MKQVAKAMFVSGGIGNNAVELGAIGEAQFSPGSKDEQLAGECSGEAVIVLDEIITVGVEILIACAIEKLAGTIHGRS